jgi:hypothetical protein
MRHLVLLAMLFTADRLMLDSKIARELGNVSYSAYATVGHALRDRTILRLFGD